VRREPGPWRWTRPRRLDRRDEGDADGTERCSPNLRMETGVALRREQEATHTDCARFGCPHLPSRWPSAQTRLRSCWVEGPWRGKKPREDRPSRAGIRRTMVRTYMRSKALKATLHADGAGYGGIGNDSVGECDGWCEENVKRATAVVTRYGCGWEESFEGPGSVAGKPSMS